MPKGQEPICWGHFQFSEVKRRRRPGRFFSVDDEGINGHNGFSVSYSGRMMQLSAMKQPAHTASRAQSPPSISETGR